MGFKGHWWQHEEQLGRGKTGGRQDSSNAATI